MGRLFAIAACVVAGGCYSARAYPGAPCTTDGECPEGLVCVADRCDLPGGQADASMHESPDGMAVVLPDARGAPGPNGWYPATEVLGVNSPSMETDPSLTDDNLTIVFTSDRAGGTGGLDLYIGTRTSTSDPFVVRELTELDSTASDQSPEISADGLTIYFSTTRNGGGDALIYKATRASTTVPFGAPAEDTGLSKSSQGQTQDNIQIGVGSTTIALVVQVRNNTNHAEGYDRMNASSSWVDEEDLSSQAKGAALPADFSAPSMLPDGTLFYYQSGSPAHIYTFAYDESSDTVSAPVELSELDLGSRDAAPEINAGGSHIVFERDGDLYEATK